MQLIFATQNQHKVDEIQAAIGDQLQIISLKDAAITTEIPEPFDTLEANASIKSKTIHDLTGLNCFSEDTGLEVDALNGEPGVKSARYAGEEKSFEQNIQKLLNKLGQRPDRHARFRTIISLIWNEREFLFEGSCEGQIIFQKRGESGFGYDPIFVPSGSDRTFSEMTTEEKNQFSHRKKAADKLIHFLREQKLPATTNQTL
ncbi:MAG: non-canonical purine NTP pyrophosphatase, RdgB/HAM1 family [Bacteroidetes bacterium]|nr:MAG: non-canonical purine NTP pyrophosphatase, RdgB/HAM1 family [Bacteroidota bacterium]